MNETALTTAAIIGLFAITCGAFAVLVPRTRRTLWIVGLSIALLVFGLMTVLILYGGFSHRNLNGRGWIMLVSDVFVDWFIFQYLRMKMGRPHS